MTRSTITKLTAVATSCSVLGLGAGALLSAQAAPSTTTTAKAKANAAKAKRTVRATPLVRAARGAVHGELTVPTNEGMKTVTLDRGTLTAISGAQLTIDESTKKLKGRTVTVTVAAGAKVRSDGKAATLGALKVGQKVAVVQLPKRTLVRAHTPKR